VNPARDLTLASARAHHHAENREASVKRLLYLAVPLTLAFACHHQDAEPSAQPAGAPASRSAASSRPVVGVTLLTRTQDFYKDLEAGLRAEAAARNLDLVVTACEMDPAKQAAQIEDFVAQRVRAILAAPCDSAAIVSNLGAAEQAHIPVFTVDIAAHGGDIVSHVASDNVLGGRLAAQAMVKAMGEKGKVAIIDHPTVASVQDRVRGFEEEIAKHPGIAIVARPSSDGQRAKAMAAMEDLLQARSDITGVFGINDDSALGAAAVLTSAGRKDVVVIGYDATPDARRAILDGGPLKADVIQHPSALGRTAIELIAKHLAGETVPPVVAVEVGVVDKDSLEKERAASGKTPSP
jgi:ribose transport system substrate-binding protein